MTSIAFVLTIIVGLGTCFFFWLVTPTLDRLRAKWRERAINAPVDPHTEAEMLKQLRMQQMSLKRLEEFRPNQTDRLLYVIGLLGAALLLFVVAVCLYVLRFKIGDVCLIPACASLIFFVFAISESRNLTDKKIDASLGALKKSIEEAKQKLKVLE